MLLVALPVLFVRQVLVLAYDILQLLGVWMMKRVNAITFSAAAMAVLSPDGHRRQAARNKTGVRLLYDHKRKAILTPA
jgi:hypothetical protein